MKRPSQTECTAPLKEVPPSKPGRMRLYCRKCKYLIEVQLKGSAYWHELEKLKIAAPTTESNKQGDL